MQTKMKLQNDCITLQQHNDMGAVLSYIIARAQKGLKYGEDMRSSRAAILADIMDMADTALNHNPAYVPPVAAGQEVVR